MLRRTKGPLDEELALVSDADASRVAVFGLDLDEIVLRVRLEELAYDEGGPAVLLGAVGLRIDEVAWVPDTSSSVFFHLESLTQVLERMTSMVTSS